MVVLLTMAAVTSAQNPNFDYGYFVTNEAGYIVGDNVYTIPGVGDWDDDGDDDLMVGVFFNGNIQYYENIAVSGEPEFTDFELVTADGSPISVTYG
jgi:hypothetical protein